MPRLHKGVGHIRCDCLSDKKFRSFDYCMALLKDAKDKVETRGEARGDAKGGMRPPPRGMRPPFKQFPKKFQQKSMPHRRFLPGNKQAKMASEEMPEDEEESESEVEGAGAAREASGDEEPKDEEANGSIMSVERDPARVRLPTSFSSSAHFAETGHVATVEDGAILQEEVQPLRENFNPQGKPTTNAPKVVSFAWLAVLLGLALAACGTAYASGGATVQSAFDAGGSVAAAVGDAVEKAAEAAAATAVFGSSASGTLIVLLLLASGKFAFASPTASVATLPKLSLNAVTVLPQFVS